MQDVQEVIFEKWILLLHEDIEKLNVRGIMNTWELSLSLGSRGVILRGVIIEAIPEMMQRLGEKYEHLLLYCQETYEGLVRLWRLRKLAKATLKGKEKKLRKLFKQEEFRELYWMLGPEFRKRLESNKTYALYLYFFVKTSPMYYIDLERAVADAPNPKEVLRKVTEKLAAEP